MTDGAGIARRKGEQLALAQSGAVEGPLNPGWDDIRLVHCSVPSVGPEEVDLSAELLGHVLRAPVVISGMTGGHPHGGEVNATLAAGAERLGLAIGLGSQRAALRDHRLVETYSVVREQAPSAMVIANIGASQLTVQKGEPALEEIHLEAVVDMVQANALAVHLNVLEELVQPEGDRNLGRFAAAVGRAARTVRVPVIAKETGTGMSREAAKSLAGAGARALDVGGAGGTNFARIEATRAEQLGDRWGVRLGHVFDAWGIPTAMSILETSSLGLPIIATGGIRSGLDAAKALALGATVVGLGRPALEAALQGTDALLTELELFLEELRVAMVLCDAPNVVTLQQAPRILTGHVLDWGQQRGLINAPMMG